MLLSPKRTKYRKSQRGRRKGMSKGAYKLEFGSYGLKAMETFWMRARHIEAVRVAINRHVKSDAMLFIRVFPDKPVSKKPAETRMGKGKGATDFWVAVVKRGRIMFELEGVTEREAREAFKVASSKLPVRTRLVSAAEGGV